MRGKQLQGGSYFWKWRITRRATSPRKSNLTAPSSRKLYKQLPANQKSCKISGERGERPLFGAASKSTSVCERKLHGSSHRRRTDRLSMRAWKNELFGVDAQIIPVGGRYAKLPSNRRTAMPGGWKKGTPAKKRGEKNRGENKARNQHPRGQKAIRRYNSRVRGARIYFHPPSRFHSPLIRLFHYFPATTHRRGLVFICRGPAGWRGGGANFSGAEKQIQAKQLNAKLLHSIFYFNATRFSFHRPARPFFSGPPFDIRGDIERTAFFITAATIDRPFSVVEIILTAFVISL